MWRRQFILFTIFGFLIFGCKTEEPQNTPTVKTKIASDVSIKTASLNGEVIDEGFTATSERGFVYSSQNSNPSVSDLKIQSGFGKGSYSVVLDKLVVNTKYYFKAYAKNTKGTSYGEIQSFITADYSLATLTTDSPKNIGYTTVEIGGIISNDGGASVNNRGICYGLNPNPTINDNKINSGGGLGSFSVKLIDLLDNKKYYVRSFATNVKGTSYGNEVTFNTTEFKFPTFINKEANSVGSTSFVVGTEIVDDGGTLVIEKGFCYSKISSPSVNDSKIKLGNGNGSYFTTIESLSENTIYYVRPYAINSKGIGYGEQIIVKTLSNNSIGLNLKQGILAFYPLNGNTNDFSGNGLNLTVKGDVLSNTKALDRNGKTLSCIGFDGNGGIITSNSKIFDSKNGFSISYWAKTFVLNYSSEGINSLKYIGLNLINSSSQELNFYISQKYYYFGSEFINDPTFTLKSKINFDNDWHHFSAVFDYGNKLIYFYVDGKLEASTSANIKNLGLLNLSIGVGYQKLFETIQVPDYFKRYAWSGYMDDIGFWNRTLSLDEVNYLYKNAYLP
jgi:hypothetical protein